MQILGLFLTDDVGWLGVNSFQDWAFNTIETCTGSNATWLEKKGDYIYLTDIISEEKIPTPCKMTKLQFLNFLQNGKKKFVKQDLKK